MRLDVQMPDGRYFACSCAAQQVGSVRRLKLEQSIVAFSITGGVAVGAWLREYLVLQRRARERNAGMTLNLPELLHEIGRGARGARALPRATVRELFTALFAGEIAELETGAIMLAYRIKGETADELAGMLDACAATLPQLRAPAEAPTPVVIPSYNGARKLPNLTPLLGLALATRGIPVLVHGDAADAWGRVSSASIFAELGVAPCRDVAQIELALRTRRLAFAPIATMSPPLARLLALRERLGVRGPAHTIAKLIQPFAAPALRLVNYTHPPYREHMAALFADAAIAGPAGVLLARGSEGEAVADPRRQVAIEWLRDGATTALVEAASADGGALDLPARAAAATARWIERALAATVALPMPLQQQIEVIERICKAQLVRGNAQCAAGTATSA